MRPSRAPHPLLRRSALFFLAGVLAACPVRAGETPPLEDGPGLGPDLTPPTGPVIESKSFVARVNQDRIDFDAVFKHWEPAWRDIIRQCAAGELTPEEADAALQEHWADAIDAAVREEIFHQEASHSIETTIERRARAMADRAGANRSDTADYYVEARARLEQEFAAQLRELVDLLISRDVRRLGGRSILLETLARQGVTFEEYRRRTRRQALIRRYRLVAVPDSRISEPRPSEIRRYYREHADEFTGPERTVFRHIFLDYRKAGGEEAAKRKALDLLEAIRDGATDFAAAVREHSHDAASAPHGGMDPLPGDAGEADEAVDPARLSWLAAVREEAGAAPPGLVERVLMSNAGCHLIEVVDRIPGRKVSFAEAQETIQQRLAAEKRDRLVRVLYRRLRKDALVEILQPTYPEAYGWETVKASPKVLRRIAPRSVTRADTP